LKLTVAYYYLPSGRLVHRKKDATDWGVQPQITVPMTPEQERAAMQQRYEQELFKRPVAKATTRSATQPATTQASQPLDLQLQRAIDTIVALVVLSGDRDTVSSTDDARTIMPPMPATTAPATQPATTESTTTPATAP
jgi:hypothetical protein